ncbi:phosphate ABC transporter permease family protein, partial [Marinobacter nauticus]
MQSANLLPIVLVLAVVAYSLAYMRSRAVAEPLGGIRNLKSLPFYYAARAALWCGIPALITLALWAGFEGKVIQNIVIGSLPPEAMPQSAGQASLVVSQIGNVAAGKLNPEFVPEHIAGAASLLETLRDQSK